MTCLKFLAHSLVEELMVDDFPSISQSENVSKLISLLDSTQNYEAIVLSDEKTKVVTIRSILEVSHPERTSVSSIAFIPPNLMPNTPIYEAAIKMVDNRIRILPVLENQKLVGLINQKKILEKMIDCEDLIDTTLDEIMVANPITAERTFTISTIRTIMSNNNISHLPIVNKEGNVEGIITAAALVKNYIKPSESQTVGERKGENIKMAEKIIRGIYDKNPLIASAKNTLPKIIRKMISLKKGYCLVVENKKSIGIITPREIINLLTQFEPRITLPIAMVGFNDYDAEKVKDAKRKIERIANTSLKFHPDLQEIIVNGRVKAIKGKRKRFEVKARAYMPSNMVAVSTEGWSLNDVLDDIVEKLDKQLRQIKRKRRPKN